LLLIEWILVMIRDRQLAVRSRLNAIMCQTVIIKAN
jgi:hypothetical protein